MNGKEILDNASNIIRRQDLDRGLLLFFINSVRRGIFRDKQVKRFFSYKENVECLDGVIDMVAYNLKSPRTIEHVKTVDGKVTKKYLARLMSYQQAMDIFGSLDAIGNPQAYLEMGTTLRILNVPATGQINIFGEFWPTDLTDSSTSTDIMAIEIPEALVSLGVAEYLDMLGEADKAAYWRNKGSVLVEAYMAQINKMDFDSTDAWKRRPFGRPATKTREVSYRGYELEDLDMGEWS
jgi:hypothetical protein